MSAEKGSVVVGVAVDVWGLFGEDNPQSRLIERYSRYMEEFTRLQFKLRISNVRKLDREKRLWDLKNRLIPKLEAQLQQC